VFLQHDVLSTDNSIIYDGHRGRPDILLTNEPNILYHYNKSRRLRRLSDRGSVSVFDSCKIQMRITIANANSRALTFVTGSIFQIGVSPVPAGFDAGSGVWDYSRWQR
jgi:hypothetical protein